MQPIPQSTCRNFADLWRDFKYARPRALSSLLTCICIALGNRNQPGFANVKDWLLAARPAIGLSESEIAGTLKPPPTPQEIVARAISGLMVAIETWTGTPTGLLTELHNLETAQTAWPQTARTISKALNLAGVLLRRRGIAMNFGPNAQITVTRRVDC